MSDRDFARYILQCENKKNVSDAEIRAVTKRLRDARN
jgi:hypothetical protein